MDVHRVSCSNESNFQFERVHCCSPIHDNIMWWPSTPANTTVYQYCPEQMDSRAHRHCLPSAEWEELTNYSACISDIDGSTLSHNETRPGMMDDDKVRTAKNLLMIMFVGSIVSLAVLLVSLIVFQRFKSLHCPRTSIHKNLIASFILRFLIVFIMFEPSAFSHDLWYKRTEWLCRALLTAQQFSYVANFFWMLVEGLYLHLILVMRPLNNEKVPFMLFYFIGWVIPLAVAVSWALVMHFKYDVSCWSQNSGLPYIFIIYVPIMLALLVNLVILANLVRIIIVKLCTGHATEQRRICRTIKSTLVLVFLLGIINLVFFTNGNGNIQTTRVYRYVNAVLPSCQGIVISLIYCGMNREVRRTLRKRWRRFLDSRAINASAYRGRSSRTSMTIVSKPNQCNDTEPYMREMQALNPKTNGNITCT